MTGAHGLSPRAERSVDDVIEHAGGWVVGDLHLERSADGRPMIRGWLLRLLLLDELRRANGGARSVAELVAAIEAAGFRVADRPSKTVSDVLRTELRRGRIVRVERGVYRLGRIPRTTAWRNAPKVALLRAVPRRLSPGAERGGGVGGPTRP